MRVLVLGYGNPDRNDDGVAWFVLQKLRADPPAGAELETAHQLEIDHAERIAQFDLVLFVDAATPDTSEPLSVIEVSAAREPQATTHHILPADVLAFARKLYGRCPRALVVRIRGCDFGFGSELSPGTRESAEAAVVRIRGLITPKDQA
jgi:hydrogenase maturation protease